MTTLADVFPDPMTLLSVAPEDLATVLLQVLQSESENLQIGSVMQPLNNKLISPDNPSLSRPRITAVYRAIAEAWSWLEREGLIVHDPESGHFGSFILTRRGRKIKNSTDLAVYRAGHLLPQGLLAKQLEEKVRPMFLRGDYDVAVFQAFKEVEVVVRAAIGASDNVLGVALMRDAFHPETGAAHCYGLSGEPAKRPAHCARRARGTDALVFWGNWLCKEPRQPQERHRGP